MSVALKKSRSTPSVGFLVVASGIGSERGLISRANAAAVVAAGLLSVVLFPLGALSIARKRETAPHRDEASAMEPIISTPTLQ